MRLVDEFLSIKPELARDDNKHYERYKLALKWFTVGIGSVVLGALSGSPEGVAFIFAGAPVAYLGGIGLNVEVPHLIEDKK